jgi:predicted DNA-binding transcriptional regulator AlpA
VARHQHDQQNVHGARAPPVRLLDKHAILALTGMSYVTIWGWMRSGQFPRSRVVGHGKQSKSVWFSTEIDAWLAGLPVRKLKGDNTDEAA